jgi:hypothetical protein
MFLLKDQLVCFDNDKADLNRCQQNYYPANGLGKTSVLVLKIKLSNLLN